MIPLSGATDGWVKLTSPSGDCAIALHQASAAQKSGAAMKFVFGVADVRAFKSANEKEGLKFGVVHVVHAGQSHGFSNARTRLAIRYLFPAEDLQGRA